MQALHAILGTPEDKTEVRLLASIERGPRRAGRRGLRRVGGGVRRLRAITTLTREGAGESAWAGRRGRLDARTLKGLFLPPPVPDVLIFVCGPPAM